jgi:glycerol-1-phosphate dehydrogenase [NAD(P)+]
VEGLIISGMAMGLAGLSRPASGMEHYFSHLWDMRALEFHTPADLHGIQCGVATLLCLKIYQFIRDVVPNREKALSYARNFSVDAWNRFLIGFLGKGAETLIEMEKKEKKYDPASHQKRLEIILEHWEDILQIISEELPAYEQLKQFMLKHGIPVTTAELGHSDAEVRDAFSATKDIRDKYIGSRLLWDLGFLNEATNCL